MITFYISHVQPAGCRKGYRIYSRDVDYSVDYIQQENLVRVHDDIHRLFGLVRIEVEGD
jgi:hypothetical protein